MVRVKVIFAWLLPTLGLAASDQHLFPPVNGWPAGCSRALSAAGHTKHAPMPDVRSFERSARLQSRRIGAQSGGSGFSLTVPSLDRQLLELGRVRLSAVTSETALDLAKRWQFQWRTALDPRAPSSVS